jgi:hypothetical protein
MDMARRQHYRDFYAPSHTGRPVALVVGNCQAESVRVLLAGSDTFPYQTVRMPPVHELVTSDLPHLHEVLRRTSVLITQPVRDDYRDLPIGTRQLTGRLAAKSAVIRWPVIRYHGLHPFSAIIRHPDDRSAVPPVVPYHDLRTLADAAGSGWRPVRTATALRASASASIAEQHDRERRAEVDIVVSDLFRAAGAHATHTINHPGNPVLIQLARRIQHALRLPADARDPGRVLLSSIHAPLDADVLDALDLDGQPRDHWVVEGMTVGHEEIYSAHRRWYEHHPQWIEAGLSRHADRMKLFVT